MNANIPSHAQNVNLRVDFQQRQNRQQSSQSNIQSSSILSFVTNQNSFPIPPMPSIIHGNNHSEYYLPSKQQQQVFQPSVKQSNQSIPYANEKPFHPNQKQQERQETENKQQQLNNRIPFESSKQFTKNPEKSQRYPNKGNGSNSYNKNNKYKNNNNNNSYVSGDGDQNRFSRNSEGIPQQSQQQATNGSVNRNVCNTTHPLEVLQECPPVNQEATPTPTNHKFQQKQQPEQKRNNYHTQISQGDSLSRQEGQQEELTSQSFVSNLNDSKNQRMAQNQNNRFLNPNTEIPTNSYHRNNFDKDMNFPKNRTEFRPKRHGQEPNQRWQNRREEWNKSYDQRDGRDLQKGFQQREGHSLDLQSPSFGYKKKQNRFLNSTKLQDEQFELEKNQPMFLVQECQLRKVFHEQFQGKLNCFKQEMYSMVVGILHVHNNENRKTEFLSQSFCRVIKPAELQFQQERPVAKRKHMNDWQIEDHSNIFESQLNNEVEVIQKRFKRRIEGITKECGAVESQYDKSSFS